MKSHTSLGSFLFFGIFFISTQTMALDRVKKGYDLTVKALKSDDGFKGESAKMEMVLINAHGEKTERKMVSKAMEVKGDGDKSIITFLWPADVKGSKMLTHTHRKEDDDQWLFLPALKRVKRISSRSKTGSFMGSEFSYEDLGSQELEKFTYKWLRDEKLKGQDHWVVERYPVDKKSGYKKHIMWMHKKILHASKVEYYDRKGELLKTATFGKYKKYKKWWRPDSIKMVNHQTKKSSIMKWKKRKLGLKFSSKDFHKNSLKE